MNLRALTLALFLTGPVQAAECRLALALALDVSSSVDDREDALQRQGLAAALISPTVVNAFFVSDQPVALAVYEWSGRYNQELLLDWRLITNRAELLNVAETISQSQRSQNEFPTAMGYALGYGAGLLNRAPPCLFQTIDMAGDGENNEGFPPAMAYAEFPFDGVTVNGLVVNGADYEAEINLIDYYRDNVLYGSGAFLVIAQGFEDYERAIRRKLERELGTRILGSDAQPRSAHPS